MYADDEQSRKLEEASWKQKVPKPKEPRALTRAHTAMETMRGHFREHVKTDLKLSRKLGVASMQDNFNHGFHGCTRIRKQRHGGGVESSQS